MSINKKNENDRKKRLRFLILIVAFIAVMLILSTYAWFSTQRSVTIANLTGNVQVAEGLEISLNGQAWTNSLDLSTLDIINDSYNSNKNIKPNELLPVSTLGTASADTTGKTILMFKGDASSAELANVTLCNEEQADTSNLDYPAYFAFDVFIRDSSASEDNLNTLYLTPTSSVQVKSTGGSQEYGLQNTVRVGFAKYSGTCTYAESASQATVIEKTVTAESSKINQVSIWEPNANYHINYILNNNNNIHVPQDQYTNFGLNSSGKFLKNTIVPTYALVDKIVESLDGNKISDVYDWDETTYFAKQNAVQTSIDLTQVLANDEAPETSATEIFPTSYAIVGNNLEQDLGVKLTDTSVSPAEVAISPNAVTRFRIYVWLEGQDVDCINYASHGGGVTVNMGLQKPASTQKGK